MADDYPHENHANSNVLLVESQKQVRRHLQELITDGCGCTTASAGTASGAIMKMDHHPFDLVLTDLSLPDADGKWLVEKISHQRPDIAVIVLSDDGSPEKILDAIRAGAQDFFFKPLDTTKLIERINHFLARTRRGHGNTRFRRRTAAHLRTLRSRRQRLAEQVELVCQDLVGGYRRTLEKLLEFQNQQDVRTAIDGQFQLKPLLATILRYLSDTFSGASGALFFSPFTTARARLFTIVGGGPPANIEDYDRALIKGIIKHTLKSGFPLVGSYSYDFDQAAADGSDFSQSPTTSSPRSLLATGLYVRRDPIAAIVLQRKRQNPFTSEEAKLLNHLSSPLASSIDLALRLESTNPSQSETPQRDAE